MSILMGGTENSYCTESISLLGGNGRLGTIIQFTKSEIILAIVCRTDGRGWVRVEAETLV